MYNLCTSGRNIMFVRFVTKRICRGVPKVVWFGGAADGKTAPPVAQVPPSVLVVPPVFLLLNLIL